jgi:hypothetical protein
VHRDVHEVTVAAALALDEGGSTPMWAKLAAV